MNTCIIVQARMGSTRFPGKVLKKFSSKPLIIWQLQNLMSLDLPIVVATSNLPKDDVLADTLSNIPVSVIRGSEENVFSRFVDVRNEYVYDHYVRITADCPWVSTHILENVIEMHWSTASDYSSNTLIRSFPDGVDVEIFTKKAFDELITFNLDKYQQEHVTAGFYQNQEIFKCSNMLEPRNIGSWRWTVDFPTDLVWLTDLWNNIGPTSVPDYESTVDFIASNSRFCRTQEDV